MFQCLPINQAYALEGNAVCSSNVSLLLLLEVIVRRLARSVHIARIMELSPSLPSSDEFAIRVCSLGLQFCCLADLSFKVDPEQTSDQLCHFSDHLLQPLPRISPAATSISSGDLVLGEEGGDDNKVCRDCVRTVSLAFLGMLNEQSYAQSHFGQVAVSPVLMFHVWF
eukprot:768375-Hanusia_phi.AAC.4